jgi:putative sporulation protein YyaC
MNFPMRSNSFLGKLRKNTAGYISVQHTQPDAIEQLSEGIHQHLLTVPIHRPIVVLCVGTDRSTGDALGPLVGTALTNTTNTPIYGTLKDPVHALNLTERVESIQRNFEKPYILAIDACLGQTSSVGTIHAGEGPVKPGAGVKKELPAVGEYHMTGIVNVSGYMEFYVLQNTRLSLVVQMSEVIADSLRAALSRRNH